MLDNVLEEVVEKDTPIKSWLVQYVGEKNNPENGEVDVEMVVNAVAQEFPDFLLAIAQENFIRGYQQALHDVDYGPLKKNEEQQPIELT
jgi:hypothetical protein